MSANPRVRLILLSNGQKGVSYIQVLPMEYFKKWRTLTHVVPRTSSVLFVEHTSDGPQAYVRAKNSGVRPLNLVYIRPQKISIWLLFSKGLRSRWVNTKYLGLC
jgi:hypothetical protein